ncbi:hypothetical protein CANINC_003970 [Pichia inconspicua]|uniref:Uncharacterized protein n=1 Tax=Pichia inconspicua TaxID=52247 RepID=A0A4T0WXA4_9ASCO|nr:hypothetical protein CANINC_003970 [[Candida] inconspicua]
MSIGSLGSVLSLNSLSDSPEQAILLTSPLLRATHIVTSAVPQQKHQYTVPSSQGNRRKLSLSPLPFRHRSFSMTLDSSISPSRVGKPRSSSSHQQPQFMANIALDMYKSQSPVISEISDIEDSPQLLATSSGSKFGNQLLQTTSNISLLSLSQQLTNNNDSQSTVMMQESESTSTLHSNSKPSNPIPSRPFMMQRKGSAPFTISNRRLSFNSPAVQVTQFVNVQTRPSIRRPSSVSHSQTQLTSNTSPSIAKFSTGRNQPIQIRQNIETEPDSPPLVPTSLANSPSQFLLSQASPPESVHSSSAFNQTVRNCHTQMKPPSTRQYQNSSGIQLQEQQQQLQQQHSKLKDLITKYSQEGNETNVPPVFPLTRENSISDSIGGRSPEFAPVSSTLPPMTPLVLSPPAEFTCRERLNADYNNNENPECNGKCLDSENTLSANQCIRSNLVTEDIFGETVDD